MERRLTLEFGEEGTEEPEIRKKIQRGTG
uniref:Uncharacterized protein n=1 Tax=Anguilla anguilla TaxID=7936 RepID=A0A0E9QSB0_ANGAN